MDVTSGLVDMTFVSYTAAKSFIQAGKVKPIAVTTAARAPFAPELPTLSEYKPLAKYQLENWFGLFAPADDTGAVQGLHQEGVRAVRTHRDDGQDRGGVSHPNPALARIDMAFH